ncbi:MAG: acyltransferase [Desulfobacter sp.]|nr:acyltransferase [Desulfobacter sp.]WDP86603.1 MAG: acyltransferase [Desulfobacter sp.]
MIEKMDTIKQFLDNYDFLFNWIRWFYPKAKGIHLLYLLYFFVPQKVMRIHGSIPWPVHYTSRILFHKNIKIGVHSAPGMTGNCYIQARNGIQIGSNFRMGPGVGLISADHSEEDYDLHLKGKPIVIGDNVWIGMNTVILPEIKIGNNVVIGANSVVTKDLPSNCVAVGNPCRVLREKKPYKGIDYTK